MAMTQNQIVPSSVRHVVVRNTTVGAIVGVDLFAFVLSALAYSYDLGMVLLFTLMPAVAVAGVAALLAMLTQRRQLAVDDLQHELEHAIAMLERGLIDEHDYHLLKDQILASHRAGRRDTASVLRIAWWAGLASTIIPSLLFLGSSYYDGIWLVAALAGGSAVGGSVAGGATFIVERVRDRLANRALQSGPSFRPLGASEDPPLG
jgi:hypothetical protein